MLAIALAIGGCSPSETDTTKPPPSVTTPPATAPPGIEFADLVTLHEDDGMRTLGQWLVSGDTVVYELRGRDSDEMWAVDRRGAPWLVAQASPIEAISLAGAVGLAITTREGGEDRLSYAFLDGSAVHDVATSRRELRFIDTAGDELVYASVGNEVELHAWNVATRQGRDIGSYPPPPQVSELAVVGDYVVLSSQGDRPLRAVAIADGAVVELARHDPNFRPRFVGAAPNGHVVVTEGRPGGGYIYTVDPANPDILNDLTADAVVELVFMEGTAVRYGRVSGEDRLLDLVTGEETAAPSRRAEPPGPVPGLEEGFVRLIATLDNGNWIVTGWLMDGAEYRALWEFNEQFGGGSFDEDVFVKGLFEYDPDTGELWQLSGPPTFSATTTGSGSGTGPDGVLRVEVLQGFVVFSTGFSGAAYDLEYNLYASPIPSLLDR